MEGGFNLWIFSALCMSDTVYRWLKSVASASTVYSGSTVSPHGRARFMSHALSTFRCYALSCSAHTKGFHLFYSTRTVLI